MKNILVPTDFTKHARKAYEIAVSIAEKTDATIHLFNVNYTRFDNLLNIPYPLSSVQLIDFSHTEDKQALLNIQSRFEELKTSDIFENVKVETTVMELQTDNVTNDIIKNITENKYDLAIIGTEGEEKNNTTVAQLVARHSTIPIITVRKNEDVFAPHNITLCTDFDNISRKFTHQLSRLADLYNADIQVLYINTQNHFMSNHEINNEFKHFKHIYDLRRAKLNIYDAYNVEDGIREYIKVNPTDMLALTTHGRTGLSHYMRGSFTEDMINQVKVPVYSYNLHDYNDTHPKYGHGSNTFSGSFSA